MTRITDHVEKPDERATEKTFPSQPGAASRNLNQRSFLADNGNEILAVLLLQPVTAFLVHRLYVAATQGRVFESHKGSAGHWVTLDAQPIAFALNVAWNVGFVLALTVLPIVVFWLAWVRSRRKAQ